MNPLRRYLDKVGMKPAHFATVCRVSPSAVSMWLSGERVPDRNSSLLVERETNGEVPASVWKDKKAHKRSPSRAA